MKICISGLSGSGKNTIGSLVASKLGLRLVNPTFKTLAQKAKMSLLEFHQKAEKDHSIDKKFDEELIQQASKGDCVITTWLGPWMIKDADLRVWLHAPFVVRSERLAKRDGLSLQEAQNHIAQRDESNRQRYLKLYKIDIFDHSNFDIVLNTERLSPQQAADIISAAAVAKGFKGKGISKRKK
ncbi:MAG: cytidylate kinase family protein [Candidatus Micrarchaeota archaeon]|nr:cytidylate kinase family protein [Candidatus Micrarchaeota archaeon]